MKIKNYKIALVTGANRGIGFETCRQLGKLGYTVILGSRDFEKGKKSEKKLVDAGLNVQAYELDITNQKTISQIKKYLQEEFDQLDVLINNAAILYDSWEDALNVDFEVVRKAFETNTIGAWQLSLELLPLLLKSEHPRIVNVSSGAGQLSDISAETPAYSLSKVALNAVTCMLAKELHSKKILVNSVCPGWVATDMGGPGGRPIEEGAKGIVWAATLPDNGPTGGFFRDEKPIEW